MSIRLRRIDGTLVALCAARSIEKEGDIYLDDEVHEALWSKFINDRKLYDIDDNVKRIIDQEESDNPNRDWWERTYGENRIENAFDFSEQSE